MDQINFLLHCQHIKHCHIAEYALINAGFPQYQVSSNCASEKKIITLTTSNIRHEIFFYRYEYQTVPFHKLSVP